VRASAFANLFWQLLCNKKGKSEMPLPLNSLELFDDY
jgi:hypothetical protein